MTTPSSESVRKIANPEAVFDQISNAPVKPCSEEPVISNDGPPRLRVVHADEDCYDDNLDQPLEIPLQIAELTGHLKRRRDELQKKEQDLNEKMDSWRSSLEAGQAANTDREAKLKVREQQLRSLQFHLLQMQNDVIDSQLSMESVIEHFENTDSDEYMKLALELLRFEVLDRFDYISKRWEVLHQKLEGLYSGQPLRKCA